jgi:uracil-DNA glycosylase
MWRFPFGRLVSARPPSADSVKPFFVLGAYPSALHVEWQPPQPFKRVQALAVDDEPTPFWDGSGHEAALARWKHCVGFDESWGRVVSTLKLNGASGHQLAASVLKPLRASASDVWLTDCLDTYRGSLTGAVRMDDTYNPWARSAGLLPAAVRRHPSEADIVREALVLQRARLMRELSAARPELIITLGNAPLRVLRSLLGAEDLPTFLTLEQYGAQHTVRIGGRSVRCLALAHPGALARYRSVHVQWATQLALAS